MYEESIYNLIPKEYVPPPKSKKYRSKHNPMKPPTGSTFPWISISPVTAMSRRIGMFRRADKIVRVIAVPADGPSLPIAISGV